MKQANAEITQYLSCKHIDIGCIYVGTYTSTLHSKAPVAQAVEWLLHRNCQMGLSSGTRRCGTTSDHREHGSNTTV